MPREMCPFKGPPTLARESGCGDLHRSDHLRHACLTYFKLSCHGLEALEISYYGRVKL
jgi:hypothetical protein